MKFRKSIVALVLIALPLLAHASCDTVKSDIDAKLKAKNLDNYSLDVVSADQADSSGGKVVGHCGGTKAIVYTRGQSKASSDDSGKASSSPAPASSTQSGG
ncbi:DUF1161 domain-containing protein [Dyella sp.]|uniref:DUF1161 domain-containing protein n=1 Tax=Dyella sp. TaxID=1869338 RepID=UPI002ED29E40